MQRRLAIPSSTDFVHIWCPLSGLAFKLNFDAAIFSNTSSSGFGAIIRNGMGEVMVGLLARGPYIASSKEGEVLACRKALEFAIDFGFREIVLEGDNATVMKSLMSPQVNMSRLGHIYEDICILATGFRSQTISCFRRGANGVAHSLAWFAAQLDSKIIWLGDSPPPALEALYLDCISLHN